MPDSITITDPLGCGRGLVVFSDDVDLTEPTLPPRETAPWAMSTGAVLIHRWFRSLS